MTCPKHPKAAMDEELGCLACWWKRPENNVDREPENWVKCAIPECDVLVLQKYGRKPRIYCCKTHTTLAALRAKRLRDKAKRETDTTCNPYPLTTTTGCI